MKYFQKKNLLLGGMSMLALTSLADITVKLPLGSDLKSLNVVHYPIANVATAQKSSELGMIEETVPVVNGIATIKTDGKDSYIYSIGDGEVFGETVYLDRNDNVDMEIASIKPYYSVVSGSDIMDAITSLKQSFVWQRDIVAKYRENGQNVPPEVIDSLKNTDSTVFIDFIENNPNSPVVPYVISNLDEDQFDQYLPKMSEEAKSSVLYPLVQRRLNARAAMQEREKKINELQSGSVAAPAFTLENTLGKNVSLSEFKGKWVILDFWGSWCIWCIKGFPELKEAYAKYADKLEVIGLDCRESKEAWLDGVKKYELPWVNLYCPEGSNLLNEYAIQAFPTKVIVDPEGMIRNVTVGHDPDFFNKLEELMGE